MSLEQQVRELTDRAAIDDMVTTYATSVDSGNWERFRTVFKDKLFLDFGTFDPSLSREIAADELVEISKKVGNFDATQHLIGNRRITVDGDRARCIADLNAAHYIEKDGQNHCCFLHGTYTYELERTGDGWKIDSYGLNVIGEWGETRAFEWVGLR